jgi:hypothetical protein
VSKEYYELDELLRRLEDEYGPGEARAKLDSIIERIAIEMLTGDGLPEVNTYWKIHIDHGTLFYHVFGQADGIALARAVRLGRP